MNWLMFMSRPSHFIKSPQNFIVPPVRTKVQRDTTFNVVTSTMNSNGFNALRNGCNPRRLVKYKYLNLIDGRKLRNKTAVSREIIKDAVQIPATENKNLK